MVRRSLAWAFARGMVVERYKLANSGPADLTKEELEFINGKTHNVADLIQGVKPQNETAH